MSTITSPAEFLNVAELVESLGDVPLHRIRMRPTPGTATEADLLSAEMGPNGRLCELIDGVLVEKTMGTRESVMAHYLQVVIGTFVLERNLGFVSGPDGSFRVAVNRVRLPDIAFVSWDRVPDREIPIASLFDMTPDLAIEVLSPSNSIREMEQNRRDYFGEGVTQVWEFDPATRTVDVFTDPANFTTLGVADTLRGEPMLPGFSLVIADVFGYLDRTG